ncbi:MAG: 50S ribosomal protein L23 [bacterium]|nr:50S ribosomal protein L23 [bacterium]
MNISEVIYKPVITEKSSQLSQKKVYAFEVNTQSDKDKIAQALETLYKVKIGSVKTIIRKGKTKKVGRKLIPKQRPDIKIAYISVLEGTIDLFPQS